jgi:outer membrane protease
MEYVYPLPGESPNELFSELIWDMKPVFYYGIQAQFSRIDKMKGPGFFFSLSFKTGNPSDSGVMEDRDWYYYPAGNIYPTRFSSHTNQTNNFFWLDTAVGASFPVKPFFYIKLFIGDSWMRFAFTGRDGYGIYNDSNPKEQIFSGIGITYQQDWLLLTAGFSAGTNILYPFTFDFSFQISPLTYCVATDNHLLREPIIVFKDFTSFGLFLEPSLSMSLVVESVEFSLVSSYRHIGKTKGKSYANEGNTGFYLEPNKTGAGLSVLDLRFLVSIRL